MIKKKQPVAVTLYNMLSKTKTLADSARKCLSDVQYAKSSPIKYDDVFYCTNTLAYQDIQLKTLSAQLKILKSGKLTDMQLKDLSKIEANISIIIFSNLELYKIYMGKDNGLTSVRQGPRKLIEDVFSGRVVLEEGSEKANKFYEMFQAFLILPPELLKKLNIDELFDMLRRFDSSGELKELSLSYILGE